MTRLDYIRRNLIELRVQHGFSQDQLAKLIGVRQGTISRIESGKSAVTIEVLFKLLQVYKVDIVFKTREKKEMP